MTTTWEPWVNVSIGVPYNEVSNPGVNACAAGPRNRSFPSFIMATWWAHWEATDGSWVVKKRVMPSRESCLRIVTTPRGIAGRGCGGFVEQQHAASLPNARASSTADAPSVRVVTLGARCSSRSRDTASCAISGLPSPVMRSACRWGSAEQPRIGDRKKNVISPPFTRY